jgi:hypothetical protein
MTTVAAEVSPEEMASDLEETLEPGEDVPEEIGNADPAEAPAEDGEAPQDQEEVESKESAGEPQDEAEVVDPPGDESAPDPPVE